MVRAVIDDIEIHEIKESIRHKFMNFRVKKNKIRNDKIPNN